MAYAEEDHRKSHDDWKICTGQPTADFPDGAALKVIDGSHGVQYMSAPSGTSGEPDVEGVCLPSPCALGCSFDRELVRDVGKACGSLALDAGRGAVLSPDAGIVRSPLFGGLADCFGEDPYLSGMLAAEWVSGVQSVGAAAVLAHFAQGRQSVGKYTCDSIIDRRALHELYLRPFEMTVRMAQPRAVYCGFNKINGLACAENAVLLTDILRRDWNFEGAILADLRMADCVASVESGVDMSYPAAGRSVRRRLEHAMHDEEIPAHYPAQSARRVRHAAASSDDPHSPPMSREECVELAVKAAEQSAVLLKNQKNTLPLPLSASIALIGRQAANPRIQQGGWGVLKPSAVKNMLHVFDENQIRYQYCEGFAEHSVSNEALLTEAVQCAAASEFAVVFVGFDDVYDNRSADRFTNRLPKAQTKLIHAVAKANPNTVVVVGGSALPKMNWIGKVRSVLYLPLGGEEVCTALFHLLFGYHNPCGRLSVSYSFNESDMPCGDTFGVSETVSEFRESIYVGYRYYNKAGLYAAFPFGYGLSYTQFAYSGMKAVKCAEGWEISLDVRNVGKRDGAEIVQLYVEPPKTDKFRPVRELKQFHKVFLTKGERRTITMLLPREAFACYDAAYGRFRVNAGQYRVCAAASSADIREAVRVTVKGEAVPEHAMPDWYLKPVGRPRKSDFSLLFGKKLAEIMPPADPPYSTEDTLNQLSGIGPMSLAVRCIRKMAEWKIKLQSRREPEYAEAMDRVLNMPVNRLAGLCRGLYPMKLTRLAIRLANRYGGKRK